MENDEIKGNLTSEDLVMNILEIKSLLQVLISQEAKRVAEKEGIQPQVALDRLTKQATEFLKDTMENPTLVRPKK